MARLPGLPYPTLKEAPKITLSKLDAATRQLSTAIELWFDERDAVSVHTLAFAAYEIIHVLSKKKNPNRMELVLIPLS